MFKARENDLLEFPFLVPNKRNRKRDSCGKRKRTEETLKDFASLALELLNSGPYLFTFTLQLNRLYIKDRNEKLENDPFLRPCSIKFKNVERYPPFYSDTRLSFSCLPFLLLNKTKD